MTFEEKLGISLGLGLSAITVVGALSLALTQNQPVAQAALVMEPAASLAQTEDAELATQRLALFFGADDRVIVPAPYPVPFAAIGQLITKNDYTCTATLVAPDLAVTAAHCFMMEAKRADAGQWFMAGFNQGEYQAKYQIVDQVFHPAFKKGLQYKGEDVYILPQAAEHDIAWLKLKLVDGEPPKPMPIFSGNRETLDAAFKTAKMKLNQGGFAEDHDAILTAHLGCTLSEFRSNNTLYHRCDTLSGDSGSPIWLSTPKGPLLIGVQSSAPDWFNREQADNVGVTVLQLPAQP
jgi:protease YdgD